MSQDTDFPANKAELATRIGEARSKLERSLARLSDAELTLPGPHGWSVKDHLAHIVAWERSLLALMQRVPRHEAMGLDQETYESHDTDAINTELYERSKDMPLEDVLDELASSHQELLEQLERSSEEDLFEYAPYANEPDGPKVPLVAWVAGNTYEHYDEHRRWIEELVGSAG
ncbi:MAG: ClbS/DfsB family four-helix bundle protein [Chloroflexota bacterium]|nr:ClbS/DfsB family four-helix bundle protein [Chloroflexota bacterium]